MTERIEQIMKRIHVLFAKCAPVDEDTPDKIIVPKRQLFGLLEELNITINDVMEQYEVTERSRERAKRRFEEKGKKIVDHAAKSAEDVYAASMLYTDRMLIDLRSVVEQAGHDLKKEYDFLEGQLNHQIAMIEENQEEVREQLSSLSQSEKYIDIIAQYNDRIMKKRREALAVEGQKKIKGKTPAIEDQKAEKQEEEVPKTMDELDISDIEESLTHSIDEVFSDMNIGQQPGKAVPKEQDGRKVGKAEDIRKTIGPAKEGKQSDIKKVASVVDDGVLLDVPEDGVKRVSYEIKVNPWYGAETGALSSADLDAEYEQWRDSGEAAVSKDEGTQVNERGKKKGKKRKKV